MFTGLVTAVGEVRSAEPRDGGVDFRIGAPYRGIAEGESIAVAGACLTVTGLGEGWFQVHAVATTLERTRFAELKNGDRVNLERAVSAGAPLGGHLVQGHVDAVGTVVSVRQLADARLLDLEVPDAVERVTIPLGSITVDGVSLTVNAMTRHGIIQVSLVPYTVAATTLGSLTAEARVHLEGDVIGKYVWEFLKRSQDSGIRREQTAPGPLTDS